MEAKDVVGRVVKKFGITENEARALVLGSLDETVKKEAEKYLQKAELFEVPFQDILRMRKELVAPAPEPVKIPVLKK